MTCLVGTANWLAAHRDQWSGTVVLIGHWPAEELVSGAKAMLDDGLYKRFPKPDFALALHVINDLPAGMVAYTSGPTLQRARRRLEVTIPRPRRPRQALPHYDTVDPIDAWPRLAILDFQTIVPRPRDRPGRSRRW